MEYALPNFDRLPGAVAVDMDGTLLNSRAELSLRTRAALEACLARGIPIVLATARPARGLNRVLPDDLAARCSFVLMNGALAQGNPPLSGYIRESLPADAVRGIVDCAREMDPDFRITVDIDGYTFGTNQTLDPAALRQRAATPDMVLTVEQSIARDPCKITLRARDLPGLQEALMRRFGDTIAVLEAKHGPPLLNVTCRRATKAGTLARLLEPHGIALDAVLAFGDDLPDAGMLQASGLSVAMGNAIPEILAICDYRTATCDEDGVAAVLEEMLRRVCE